MLRPIHIYEDKCNSDFLRIRKLNKGSKKENSNCLTEFDFGTMMARLTGVDMCQSIMQDYHTNQLGHCFDEDCRCRKYGVKRNLHKRKIHSSEIMPCLGFFKCKLCFDPGK